MNLANTIVFCIFIGIAEEFLCRGWIQNEFMERFSNSKKEVIISIILSSLVFGFMHIINLSVQGVLETIIQIFNATALGVLLGSIYYKTKNIWSIIFLHSFYDFALFIGDINTVKDCSFLNPSTAFILAQSFTILVLSAIWIICSINVLNKCEFDKEDHKKSNKINSLIICILFVVCFLPVHKLVPNYDKYIVCYEYKSVDKFENYTLSYPNYDKYIIKDDYHTFEIYIEDDKVIILNKNTNYKKEMALKNIEDLEVFKNKDKYEIVVNTSNDEGTIYYSDYFVEGQMSDEEEYLSKLNMHHYVLPSIESIGYIETDDNRYPYIVSINNDKFVIINKEIYIINKKK